MGYDPAVITAVNAAFRGKRAEKEAEAANRREQLNRRLPRLLEIEKILATTAITLSREIISGGDIEAKVRELRARNSVLISERAAILASEGLPEDYLEIVRECGICGDTGAVGLKRCECYDRALKREAFRSSKLGSALKDCLYENFRLDFYSDKPSPELAGVSPRKNMEMNLRLCKKFSKDPYAGKNLLLYGACGLGKTFLSAAVAADAIENGFWAVYETSGRLFDTVSDIRFGRSDGEGRREGENYEACDLLIIDDLGTEFINSVTISALYQLVNSRLLEGKPMVISTNASLKDLENLYGARLVSRFIGEFTLLRFCGEDIRAQKNRGM